jgi:hypothetical protein
MSHIFQVSSYIRTLSANWLFALMLPLFLYALYTAVKPETEAVLLSSAKDWEVLSEHKPVLIPPTEIVPKNRYIRGSVERGTSSFFIRNWTPEGNKPLKIRSVPFQPTPYMSVLVTGASRTPSGKVHAYLEHESNGQRIPVYLGNVGYNLAEAIVKLPESWQTGSVRLYLEGDESYYLFGVGSVHGISRLSYLKSGFLGQFAFFVVSFLFFGLILQVGAALAMRMGWREILPSALLFLGLLALIQFYLINAMHEEFRDLGTKWYTTLLAPLLMMGIAVATAGRAAQKQAFDYLSPYFRVWFVGALAYFALLGLTYSGSAHWEPNYRFWPAIWSSDNELPALFAEALFRGWKLEDLFTSGSWMPSDRPPLMSGAHLLMAEWFHLLQSQNDGSYLRGIAYNTSAIVLNTLWIPITWWLLEQMASFLGIRQRYLILLLVAITPFSIFNSIYGWPKAFGAAFAMVSLGLIWVLRKMEKGPRKSVAIGLFFMGGSLSMLAHASVAFFLMPMGVVFLWYHLKKNIIPILLSFGLALAVLLSWDLYKKNVLPSSDPLIKLALTGDWGFSKPNVSTKEMIVDFYGKMPFKEWLDIKRIMFQQSFRPIDHSITNTHLSLEFGADPLGVLRAWDVLLLSKGNALIPLLLIFSFGYWFFVALRQQGNAQKELSPFFSINLIALACWVVIVLAFILPVVIPHIPQPALFGILIAGGVLMSRVPRLFRFAFVVQLVYTVLVWGLGPLLNTLRIDALATGTLLVLAVWGIQFLSNIHQQEYRGA